MLLSEIHHRVKNNMQIISSLLMIQSHRIQDEKFKEVIKESQQRIKTMALVHEKLYENRDFSKININDYINSLIDDISNSYILEGKINIKTDIDNKVFDLDTLVPLGLIINELITNALKYAFKNRENGNIFIKFNETEKDYFVLTVRDDGVGLIEEKKPEDMGIGSELIKSLTAQLEGTYDIEDNNGVIVTITFNAKTF
ncbi:MAG: sensor histidine kinase [Methanobacteriaceae archaeon]|nr:sensor histidine kinase [Methanobacteriaceae archaeon]